MAGMVPVRPSDEELDEGYALLSEFFDSVAQLPMFKRLQSVPADDESAFLEKWREFPRFTSKGVSVEGTGGFRGHLLLRPLGQIILANAVAELVRPEGKSGCGLTMKTVFRRLSALDASDGFEAHRPSSVWWGVTYNADTTRVLNRAKSWGHMLLVQLVAGLRSKAERMELWEDWVWARSVDINAMTWKNLEGRVARFRWEIPELPEPLRE